MNKHPHYSVGSFDYSTVDQREGGSTYFRASNNFIFVNPIMITKDETIELLETIKKRENQHIHIFIDQMYPDMIIYLSSLMIMTVTEENHNKITIHIHKNKKSLINMIEIALHGIPVKRWKISREGDSVRFKINTVWMSKYSRLHDQFLVFRYEKNGLTASIDLASFETPTGFCTNKWSSTEAEKKQRPDGPFVDEKFINGMDKFRDIIIQKFKDACPPGILKGFKTDEEIWEFMNQQADIQIREVEDKRRVRNEHNSKG